MSDLIRREDAIDAMIMLGIKRAVPILVTLPSAKPERKKGKWITHDYALGRERYECEICGNRCNCEYDFCPNCGADMRGDHE